MLGDRGRGVKGRCGVDCVTYAANRNWLIVIDTSEQRSYSSHGSLGDGAPKLPVLGRGHDFRSPHKSGARSRDGDQVRTKRTDACKFLSGT